MRISVLSLAVLLSVGARADAWRPSDAERLLVRWCDGLLRHQVRMDDPRLDGGLLCPACCFQHGRAADAVYPLVAVGQLTGDARYLDCARRLIDWSERNMVLADGANYNDVKNYWRSITVFSQIAIGKTLARYGNRLPDDFRGELRRIFDRQTGFLISYFNKGLGTSCVNYPIAFCEAMAVAYQVTGDRRYLDRGTEMVKLVRPLFTPEGLLAGEGHPSSGWSLRGCRPVDLGYNLEESLPALYHYATVAKDEALLAEIDRLLAGHLAFFLPDGGLDNSAGSRSNKWTYYGSRTSDGLLPALAHYAMRGGPSAVRAIDRHLGLLARLTSDDGLLYGGYAYREAGEPACIHHTFAHAKALADLLFLNPPTKASDGMLPPEFACGRRSFPSFQTELSAIGPWRATFSANDNFASQWPGNTTGGSLMFLWHPAFGPVCAATMSEYRYVEYTNFQGQRRYADVVSLTPRLEDGRFASCNETNVTVNVTFEKGVFSYAAKGHLTATDGSQGAAFCLAYELSEKGLSVQATSDGAARYVLPIIAGPKDRIDVTGSRAEIRRPGGTLVLTADRPIRLEETPRGKLAFNPVGGFLAAILTVDLAEGSARCWLGVKE